MDVSADTKTPAEQIAAFIRAIYFPDDVIIFDPLIVEKRFWFTSADGLEEPIERILAANSQKGGRNGYVGLNPRRVGETGATGTAYAVAYFADFDGIGANKALMIIKTAGMPRPPIVVASGSGTHAYWPLIEPEYDLGEWEHRQEWIALQLGSDNAVCDRQRLTRLPGTINRKPKYRDNPPLATLIRCEMGKRFSWHELQPSGPEPVAPERPASAPRRPRSNGQLLPGDDFMARGSWADVLPTSWRPIGRMDAEGRIAYTNGANGQNRKTATVFTRVNRSRPAIYIWDTEEKVLPARKMHTMFFAYAAIHHGGDLTAATKALADQGYGKPAASEVASVGQDTAAKPPASSADFQPTLAKGGTLHRLMLQSFAEVEARDIDWLWPMRIVSGGLTILTGAVGQTKSMLTIDLAARVSLGGKHPDGTGVCPVGEVLLFGHEDAIHEVVKPRLVAAGANCEKVFYVHGKARASDATDPEEAERVLFSEDIDTLRQTLQDRPGIKLLIFDPLPEFIRGDHNAAAEVREALMPLNKIAQEFGVAIVAVCHQNKKVGLSAVQSIAGSGGFVQVARTVLAVVNDPDDTETGFTRRRLMVVAKSNYGGTNEAQAYRLVDRGDGRVAIEWLPEVLELDADEIVRSGTKSGDGRKSADLHAAVALVKKIMERSAGVMPAREAEDEMRQAGHSRNTIQAAKPIAGVRSRKSGMAGGWVWEWEWEWEGQVSPVP